MLNINIYINMTTVLVLLNVKLPYINKKLNHEKSIF